MKTDNLTSSFLELRDKLHRSAVSFLKNDEEAKDAVQESYLRLWKSGEINSKPEIQNKLFTILRNLCIDRLRRTPFLPLSKVNAEKISTDSEDSIDMEDYEKLIMDGLTEFQKQIYRHLIGEGKGYEEIADDLSMSVDAVRMNMSRIRKKVRENIKKFKI